MVEFVDKALSVPYSPLGRSMEGWDCWGLVHIAYEQILGIKIPSYADYQDAKNRDIVQKIINHEKTVRDFWTVVENPREMDLVMIKTDGFVCHVGLHLGQGRMLHCTDKLGTRVERLHHPLWTRRIDFYGRYVRG